MEGPSIETLEEEKKDLLKKIKTNNNIKLVEQLNKVTLEIEKTIKKIRYSETSALFFNPTFPKKIIRATELSFYMDFPIFSITAIKSIKRPIVMGHCNCGGFHSLCTDEEDREEENLITFNIQTLQSLSNDIRKPIGDNKVLESFHINENYTVEYISNGSDPYFGRLWLTIHEAWMYYAKKSVIVNVPILKDKKKKK